MSFSLPFLYLFFSCIDYWFSFIFLCPLDSSSPVLTLITSTVIFTFFYSLRSDHWICHFSFYFRLTVCFYLLCPPLHILRACHLRYSHFSMCCSYLFFVSILCSTPFYNFWLCSCDTTTNEVLAGKVIATNHERVSGHKSWLEYHPLRSDYSHQHMYVH